MDLEQKTNGPSIKEIQQILLSIIGILTPAFYIIGLSFYQGYIGSFGINYGSFEISTQRIFEHAYYFIYFKCSEFLEAFTGFIFSPYCIISIISIFFFFLILLYVLLLDKKKLVSIKDNSIANIFRDAYSSLSPKTKCFLLASKLSFIITRKLVLFVLVFSIIPIAWFSTAYYSYKFSSDIAKKNIIDYIENGCSINKNNGKSNCISISTKDGRIIYSGFLVEINDKKVAIFTEKEGSVILKIPEDALIKRELRSLK